MTKYNILVLTGALAAVSPAFGQSSFEKTPPRADRMSIQAHPEIGRAHV